MDGTGTSHIESSFQSHLSNQSIANQACVCKRRRSRGNRKLQHFTRKCRARGKSAAEISMLVNRRSNTDQMDAVSANQSIVEQHRVKANKRKRQQPTSGERDGMTKSMSQLSVSQPSPKRRKEKTSVLTTKDTNAPRTDGRLVVEHEEHRLYLVVQCT